MWLKVFALLLYCIYSCQPASVFVEPRQAHGLLIRRRRFNSGWFEELQKGDLERECLEEKCSHEEVREVFEHAEATEEFWKGYNAADVCASAPCQNGGMCSGQGSTFICYCNPPFSGTFCHLEKMAVPQTCLDDNGGCEHFCNEATGSRTCSCADDYFLSEDGYSCVAKELISCGTVPVQPDLQITEPSAQVRIVGGTVCPKGHCPWQVLLKSKGKGYCGGVIYRPSWVLTASHCLEDTQAKHLQVVAGEHNIELEEGTEQVLQVAQIYMHEHYESSTADNDIALLRLATPIALTPYAVPVCLPTRPQAERVLWAVHMHTVSGWGRRSEYGPTSHLLRWLQVPRIRTAECQEQSGVQLSPNMFCAGYIEGLQDSCKGDSGGPLVTHYRKTTFLLGIVSWGRGCAQPGNYGIYTRVSNYLEWIQKLTEPVVEIPEANGILKNGLKNQTRPLTENVYETVIENQTGPLVENLNATLMENQTGLLVANLNATLMENQTGPLVVNLNATLMENQTGSLLANLNATLVENQTGPLVMNLNATLMEKQTGSLIVNLNATLMENQTGPLVENLNETVMENQTENMVEN